MTLDISINNFAVVPELSQYKMLQNLNMSRNRITTLDRSSLLGLEQLRVLDLSYNRLSQWTDINKNAFKGLPNLIDLDLSYNSLKGFPEIYNPLKSDSLKVLRVMNCSITDVHGDILSNLPQLEEFSMSLNTLGNLRAQINSTTLTKLDMSNCRLKTVDTYALTHMPNLKFLNLAKNEELKTFNCHSLSLERIDLSSCNIGEIPTGSLPNVVSINLSGNHLRRLTSRAFKNLSGIKFLDLSNTAISKVEYNAFDDLDEIRSLDLSYNTISSIDSLTFSSNFRLTKLIISHNYLSKVPRFSSESLKYLDISNCEIRFFGSESLTLMRALEVVDLSRNIITQLPDYIDGENLRKLDLSMCHISSINNKTFSRLSMLNELNLAGNSLTTGIKVAYFPPTMKSLHLDDNPWRCDCSFDQLQVYEFLLYLGNYRTPKVHCQSPENMEGLLWNDACESAWYPANQHSDYMWWYSCGLICAMVLLMCAIFSIRRAYRIKERRLEELAQEERDDALERLRRMQLQQLQTSLEENRNAPDPRESPRPPSYHEALRMATPHGSYHSLAGSRTSLSNERSMTRSGNQNGSRKSTKRKRPKEKGGDSSRERNTNASRTRRNNAEDSEEETTPQRPPPTLESDF